MAGSIVIASIQRACQRFDNLNRGALKAPLGLANGSGGIVKIPLKLLDFMGTFALAVKSCAIRCRCMSNSANSPVFAFSRRCAITPVIGLTMERDVRTLDQHSSHQSAQAREQKDTAKF